MLNFTSWLMGIEASLLAFETGSSGIFVSIAASAVTGFAIVMVCMYGIRALQAIESGEGMPLTGFFVLMLKFGLCLFVILAWNVPAPGLGVPIGTWIPNEGLHLAQLIGWNGAQQVASSINSWAAMETPMSIFSLGWIWWLMAEIWLFLASVLLAIILVGPLLFVAVLVIIGPLFIPMWPVPELTSYARGYVRCLITYSLVPVIAAATLTVMAQIILPSLDQFASGAMSVETALPKAFLLCVSLAVSVWGLMEVISRANHIMSGSAGSGLGWFTAGLAMAKGML